MQNISRSVDGLIGRTPMLRLARFAPEANLVAKLESFNPCSSVKDRIALGMIEAFERDGAVDENTVFVEATSGNTGIGLASVCAARGYRLKLVMPDSMSVERRRLLKMLGAELVLTPGAEGMGGAVKRAEKTASENPHHILVRQFENPANPLTHRLTTAVEIWGQTEGGVDVLVAGVGTGGTITGAGRALKEKKPEIEIVAVEPEGSPVLSGGKPGPHKIQGIGAGFIPEVLDVKIIDRVVAVSDGDAAAAVRRLARTEGVLAGISSGAALHAALRVAAEPGNGEKMIAVILPDTGERYASTWLFEDDNE